MNLWAQFVHPARLDADKRFDCTEAEFAAMLAEWEGTPAGAAFRQDVVPAGSFIYRERLAFQHFCMENQRDVRRGRGIQREIFGFQYFHVES